MSIIDAFDSRSEEILKPGCIASPIDGFPDTVLVTFQPVLTDILRSLLPVEIVSTMDSCVQVPVYRFWYRGRCLGLYMTTIGGPAAVGLMEEVLVKGAKKILLFGACGVLEHSLAAGHLILPTAAYRDEGTSYHYLPPSDYVEIPTARRLGEIFEELRVPYVYGKTWTTDAIYRETRNNAEARRREGCIAVEMECASVMAAGQFRGKPVYQFLYAEDSLDGSAWDARTWHGVPRSAYEKYLQIALETAVRL